MRTQIEIQKLEQQFEFEVSMTFEFNNAEMGVSVFIKCPISFFT